jgi:hypothetical protein
MLVEITNAVYFGALKECERHHEAQSIARSVERHLTEDGFHDLFSVLNSVRKAAHDEIWEEPENSSHALEIRNAVQAIVDSVKGELLERGLFNGQEPVKDTFWRKLGLSFMVSLALVTGGLTASIAGVSEAIVLASVGVLSLGLYLLLSRSKL